nr:retrovirus-related Pol polyprotein from transposon TNT 1-94 [Tanacetum cinerariifolium]
MIALKPPMLKIGDYDLWIMRMEQYLTHTDYALWEVIVNGDAPAAIASVSGGADAAIPPKTNEQKIARRNELKEKSTLSLAIPDEHLLKFYRIKDAKTLWEDIKTRFGGNKESKKMQKTILRQQYENFTASRSGNANLKLLRSLPPTWNTHTIIVRNKSDLDTLSMDDLYNNLKVYEAEIKGQSSSNSNSQNLAFVSLDNTSSTNEAVNTAHNVSAANNEDLEQIDTDYLREMDLKWQRMTIPSIQYLKQQQMQMSIHGCQDFFEAIQARFRGNDATKKTQKTLLKQMYKNFNAPSTESHDFIFNRIQKIVSQLAILGENISQEDLNMKCLRSLPADTNEVDTANIQVSAVSTPISTVSTHDNTANLSEAIVYAFLANQPDGSQLVHEDLEQIHEDNLEEMDLKWQLALLSMRARRYFQRTGKKIIINGSDIASYDKTKKIVSQLAILGESISQEDLNMKFLRSLPVEWNTHIIVGRNKVDLDTISIDDLYNNFKIIEQEFKRMVTSSSSSGSQNMAFLSSFSGTNKVDTANIQVTNQPNGSQLMHEDLEQIHEDNLEEMDLKWQLALLGMRARRSLRNQESMPRNQDSSRKAVNVEDTSSKAMVAIDGAGFDWSYMDDDEVPTNMALMAFSDSKMVQKPVLKNVEKGIGQREVRSVWNNAMRINNQNFSNSRRNFAPIAVLTKYEIVPISTARQSSSRAAAPVCAARPINSAAPNPLMCDKKNSVLFTETECLILSPNFKLSDESQILLKVPKKNNMYSFDLKNVVPSKGLTCLFAKAINDESNLWHRRLGHISFKTMNKLVKGNLVRGLPLKIFENDHTCVPCQKGKQHKASYKSKLVNFVSQPLQILHMDLFGPTFIKSIMGKMYFLVVTDDYNRVLVTKPHNKTPYELLIGRTPIISFMRPFGCPITILNTLDHLGKFDGKANEGFLVGYFTNNKAFRVNNSRTRKVKENLHVNFLENKLNVARSGLEWLFDIDSLTSSMNYQPISAGNRTNGNADVPSSHEEIKSSPKDDAGKKSTVEPTCVEGGKTDDLGVNTVGSSFSHLAALDDFSKMPNMEDTRIFNDAYDDKDEGAEANYNNLETMKPKKVTQALDNKSWVEAMQEELLQFKLLNVWTLVDLPHGKRPIGTKWIYRNKRDQRVIVVRNKARLVAQGHTQEKGIDYDEVFTPIARIEAIRLFLAYPSFMDLTVYQMDVKSAILYDTIKEEVYVSQPLGFVDPEFPDRVSMIGSLMYLASSKLDIMFDVCACLRFQVQPKVSHMHVVKRIFRYLKGQPTLGLWYPKDLPLELIAYSDSDYVGAGLDRKSTTGEYIAASNYYGQVLWLQNQLLNDGYNFMQTKIHMDNESPICVVKNHVYHSKTKHIEIRHHFIKDSYEKRLIEMVKIHTDYNISSTQQMVINSPCLTDKKELTIPKQTVKDKQEKDKIRTKPDKNGKRGKARQYCGVLPETDHCQPPQYTVNHPIFNAHNDILNANNDLLNSQNKITIAQNKLIEQLASMYAMIGQFIQKKHEDEQANDARYWKIPACSDDDDDYNFAIRPNEPVDSLSMRDEHLNTISVIESDEFIKSSVEKLVPNPSESKGENGCDVPACFTTFSNVLFDADYEFDSVNDQSVSDEDFWKKIFSNPLFEEEIIPMKIDQHHDNVESDLVESMCTHDSSLIISSKIDSLLYEFAGELTLLKSIPPRIDETDCYHENEIRLTKRLLYDNSSPRLPKEFVFENSDADIESFSPSPIPIKDSDSLME